MIGKKAKLSIKLAISCAVVIVLALNVDIRMIFTALEKIDIRLYFGSLVFGVGSIVLVACKYSLLIKGTSLERSIFELTRINFISRFYALFLPSAVGPEAVRWYKITRNKQGRMAFLAATVFERLTFIFILLLCGLIPLLFFTSNTNIALLKDRILPLILLILAFVAGALVYFCCPPFGSFLRSIIRRMLAFRGHGQRERLLMDQFAIRKDGMVGTVSYLLLWGLMWQISFVLRVFVLFKSADLPFGFLDVTWMGSLVLLLQVLPLSFAGIGLREGAYAYLFTLFGLPSEMGVLTGLLFFSQMLVFSSIGGLLELLDR